MACELRPLVLPVSETLQAALGEFDCCGEAHADDPIAKEVNGFLREGDYRLGLEQDLSTTYLWVDVRGRGPRRLVGYTTLALDSLRLNNDERRRLERPTWPDIGAIRIVMIGVDHRCQGGGEGSALLETVTGLAQRVRELVAVRFLVADVNVRKEAWYAARGFVINKHHDENDPQAPGQTVSMRLDLRAVANSPGE